MASRNFDRRRGHYSRERDAHQHSSNSQRSSRSSRGNYRGRNHEPERHQRSSDARQRDYDASRPRMQSGIRYLTSDDIKSLVQSSPADVLACVNENEAGFLAAYSHEKYCKEPLMMKHLIKMLYLLVKTQDLDRIASRIIARILSADGSYALFIMKLDHLIKGMVTESRGFVKKENPQYLNYLLEIGTKAITVIPETVLNTFPLLVIRQAIEDLIKKGEPLDSLKQKVHSLEQAFAVAREDRSRTASARGPDTSYSDPPEHFKYVDILPTKDELYYKDDQIYLRPNVINGAYRSWDHYLDVQYRLLREDFLRPLRHGIQHYRTSGSMKKSQDIRMYEHVNVLNPVCLLNGICFQIHFDSSKFGRVNWEYSRRLIYGSLLCLSSDNFQGSIIFASVVKRDPELLKDGYLIIKLENENSFQIDTKVEYTMVESAAYFEAYRHILSKLKEMSSTHDEIPFRPYIVDCKFHNIPPPLYFSNHYKIRFNLRDILDIRSDVALLDGSSWPTASATCLDPSQFDALKMALTKEVSVIQGPPGTGKTYIGLKIVEAFLQNRTIWDRHKEAPILVVCYTNHALDQFLEGIQKLRINGEGVNIIRIGGRCKSEKLSNSVLRKKVKEYQQSGNFLPRKLLRNIADSRNGMFANKNHIENLLKNSTSESNKLIALSELKNVMSDSHYVQLSEGIQNPGREMEEWLELLYYASSIEPHLPAAACNDEESVEPMDTTEPEKMQELDSIEVDNEVKLMEEDRILEGEEVEFLDEPVMAHREEIQPIREGDNDGWTAVPTSDAKRSKIMTERLNKAMTQREAALVQDVWNLPLLERWRLYSYWRKEYAAYSSEQIQTHAERYEQACEMYIDSLKEVDEHVLLDSDVIGITTTGAAKHHHFLKKIHPKLVIFEEAAEIFEAHVITSLGPSVQQLILIGDHKQLQPKPNCYDLERNYSLSVSLFERLIMNGCPFVTLGVQHRMRPEISKLIHPSIYRELSDHHSVTKYDHINGIAHDVFMIDHCHPEVENHDSDTTTHVNVFEADYIVALCRYLLKQGYDPSQITILTMYRGQLLELKRKMKRRDFEGVRVAAVDDFQGEENDIILLSLVRSNSDENIGFLSTTNRICVSLSRAKRGLYIIGNLSMLRGKDKTVWPEIISDLEECGCVGKALPLQCRVHAESKVLAEEPEDFLKCPEGGCDQKCGARLQCGHVCPRVCHPNDMSHTKYRCQRVCQKTLPCGHSCRSTCYKCSSHCEPCSAIKKVTLPVCKHRVEIPCSADPATFQCPRLCEKLLKCGHGCQNPCSEHCTRKCNVKVERTLTCGHTVQAPCYEPLDAIKCHEPCNASLECGHQCVGTCGKCHMGRLHVSCKQNCGRTLVCGHICSFPCASNCPPCMKPCNNFCVHSRCPKKCYELCDPCMESCKWRCKHFKCTRRCGEPCDRPACNKPCDKTLKCGHSCIGLCGEKCPDLCRVCNSDIVCEIFFGSEDEEDARFIMLEDCGHFFEVESLDDWVNSEGANPGEVQFKACPKCKTPIRKSLRYGNIIKQTLEDVEAIKRKQLLPKSDLEQSLMHLTLSAEEQSSEIKTIKQRLAKKNLHPYHLITIEVQIEIITKIIAISKIFPDISQVMAAQIKSHYEVCNLNSLHTNLKSVTSFVMQEFLSHQQISEVVCETRRIACAAKLCDLLCKLRMNKCNLSQDDTDRITENVRIVHESGWKSPGLTEESEDAILALIKDISEVYNVNGLSKKEKDMIVTAIGLPKGHWYKCPNGHFYCIADCGGATVKSKCPECGAVIGGQQHRLADGNEHAPEMDGSHHAAWSEGANLANYDPNQLRLL